MKAKLKKSETIRKQRPRFTKRFVTTVSVAKIDIDPQIKLIKKYSKWMILMQLPMVEPILGKYCNFDYNAYLIKKRIKAFAKSLGPHRTMVDKQIQMFENPNLKQIPDHWKSSPYKMNLEDQVLEGNSMDKLTFDQYCKFFGFSKADMYESLPHKIADTLRRNVRVAVLDTNTIVPYHFFCPAVARLSTGRAKREAASRTGVRVHRKDRHCVLGQLELLHEVHRRTLQTPSDSRKRARQTRLLLAQLLRSAVHRLWHCQVQPEPVRSRDLQPTAIEDSA